MDDGWSSFLELLFRNQHGLKGLQSCKYGSPDPSRGGSCLGNHNVDGALFGEPGPSSPFDSYLPTRGIRVFPPAKTILPNRVLEETLVTLAHNITYSVVDNRPGVWTWTRGQETSSLQRQFSDRLAIRSSLFWMREKPLLPRNQEQRGSSSPWWYLQCQYLGILRPLLDNKDVSSSVSCLPDVSTLRMELNRRVTLGSSYNMGGSMPRFPPPSRPFGQMHTETTLHPLLCRALWHPVLQTWFPLPSRGSVWGSAATPLGGLDGHHQAHAVRYPIYGGILSP